MPGHLVRRLQQIATALFTEECGGYDLTPVQFAALVAIGSTPGIDATRLSLLIAFDRSTLGDVLERLEVKGWVARRPSPKDRRIKCVALTESGCRLLEEVQPAVRRVQDRLMAPLSPVDRTTMLRLMSELADRHADTAPAPFRLVRQR